MNTKFLFRGKRVDGNGWVYGDLVHRGAKRYIFPPETLDSAERYEVDRDTVGIRTGLKDKKGVKIFTGDIIKTHYANAEKCDFVEKVVFRNGRFCACYENGNTKQWAMLADGIPRFARDKSVYMEWCEVIGNVHDYRELTGREMPNETTDAGGGFSFDENDIDALRHFRNYCKSMPGDCNGCAIGNQQICPLASYPGGWDLDEVKKGLKI